MLEIVINEEKSYHRKFARCLPPEQRDIIFPPVPSNTTKIITPFKNILPKEELKINKDPKPAGPEQPFIPKPPRKDQGGKINEKRLPIAKPNPEPYSNIIDTTEYQQKVQEIVPPPPKISVDARCQFDMITSISKLIAEA